MVLITENAVYFYIISLWYMIFSKIYEKQGNTEIGR